MSVRLTLLTILEVAGLAVGLIYSLFKIATTLERIGGTGDSYLAKIRFGVRAIEKQTSHLGPEVDWLNRDLLVLNQRLGTAESRLRSAAGALARKEPQP